MVNDFLKSCRPSDLMSIPSIKIFPTLPSISLNKTSDRDDFPAPVLPTIPI